MKHILEICLPDFDNYGLFLAHVGFCQGKNNKVDPLNGLTLDALTYLYCRKQELNSFISDHYLSMEDKSDTMIQALLDVHVPGTTLNNFNVYLDALIVYAELSAAQVNDSFESVVHSLKEQHEKTELQQPSESAQNVEIIDVQDDNLSLSSDSSIEEDNNLNDLPEENQSNENQSNENPMNSMFQMLQNDGFMNMVQGLSENILKKRSQNEPFNLNELMGSLPNLEEMNQLNLNKMDQSSESDEDPEL